MLSYFAQFLNYARILPKTKITKFTHYIYKFFYTYPSKKFHMKIFYLYILTNTNT